MISTQLSNLHVKCHLYTKYHGGTSFANGKIVDTQTHFKHPPSVKKSFVKGETLRLLKTQSKKTSNCLRKRDRSLGLYQINSHPALLNTALLYECLKTIKLCSAPFIILRNQVTSFNRVPTRVYLAEFNNVKRSSLALGLKGLR